MRENLKAAQSSALKLNDRINNLDGNSRALLAELAPDTIDKLYSNLSEIIESLNAGLIKAKAYGPAVKRQVDTPRLILAAHIRHLMIKYLQLQPTATKDGLFEDILKAVFTAIKEGRHKRKNTTKAEEPSVHDLAIKAMRVRVIENEEGTLEIDPWVD